LPSSKRYGIEKPSSTPHTPPNKIKTTTTTRKSEKKDRPQKEKKKTVQQKGKNKFIKNLPYPNPKKGRGVGVVFTLTPSSYSTQNISSPF